MAAAAGGGGDDDELARQRTWHWMNQQPEIKAVPRSVSSGRSRGRRSLAAATHVVEERKGRVWVPVHHGSERDCASTLDLLQRHFPDKVHRSLSIQEAKRDAQRKTWSVRDPDHVPIGSRVLLARSPDDIHPSARRAHEAFGMHTGVLEQRYGFVRSRHRTFGSYMVDVVALDFTKRRVQR